MKLTYTVSEQEYLRGLTLYFRVQRDWYKRAVVIAGMITVGMAIFIWWFSNTLLTELKPLMIVVLTVGTATGLVSGLTARGQAKSTVKLQKRQGWLTADFFGVHIMEARQEQLVMTVGGQIRELAWQELSEVREREGFLLLFYNSKYLYEAVPPSAFSSVEIRAAVCDELRARMRSELPTATPMPEQDAAFALCYPAWTAQELEDVLVRINRRALMPYYVAIPSCVILWLLLTLIVRQMPPVSLAEPRFSVLLSVICGVLGFAVLTSLIIALFLLLGVLPWMRSRCRRQVADGLLSSWLRGPQCVEFKTGGVRSCRDGSGELTPWDRVSGVYLTRSELVLKLKGFHALPIPLGALQSDEQLAEIMAYIKENCRR